MSFILPKVICLAIVPLFILVLSVNSTVLIQHQQQHHQQQSLSSLSKQSLKTALLSVSQASTHVYKYPSTTITHDVVDDAENTVDDTIQKIEEETGLPIWAIITIAIVAVVFIIAIIICCCCCCF